MPIFTPVVVPRTKIADQNPFHLGDDDEALQEFFAPSHKWFGREVIPPDNKWNDGSDSFMAPINHYHLLQTETFYVESGVGLWYMQGQSIERKAGETITIPKWIRHRFVNRPGSTEPLVISYRYDRQRFDMEERFFRNGLTYLDDCRKHKIAPSVLQLSVFLADCWMPGDFIQFPQNDYVRCLLNTIFTFGAAWLGRLLYGYKGSYIEYYDPVKSEQFKREREQELKKRR